MVAACFKEMVTQQTIDFICRYWQETAKP